MHDKPGINYLIVFEICPYIAIYRSKRKEITSFSILSTWNYAKLFVSLGDDNIGIITIIKVGVCMSGYSHVALNYFCIYWLSIHHIGYTVTNFTKKHLRG